MKRFASVINNYVEKIKHKKSCPDFKLGMLKIQHRYEDEIL